MINSRKGMASVESILAIAVGALVLMGLMQFSKSSLLPKMESNISQLFDGKLNTGNLGSPDQDKESDSNSQNSETSAPNTSQEDNGVDGDPDVLDTLEPPESNANDSIDELPFPDDVKARRQEISDLLSDPSTSETERILLLAELTEIDRNHALRKAGQLEVTAQRLDRQASLADLVKNEELANELRAESERRKLEAAQIRDGDQGFAGKQKQIDAANAMRDLFDVADNFSDALPKPVEKIYDWVKYPIRDGLPQITEAIIDAEQGFHSWLREKVSDTPDLKDKAERARQALQDFLEG